MTTPALVGSAGTAATGSDSAAPSFGQSTTSGNLLVAWANSNDSGSSFPISISDSSWTLAKASSVGDGNWTGVWYKADCGSSETAPSFSDSGAAIMVASLAEFSGVATSSPLDQTGTSYGSPVTASAVDSAVSDLIVAVATWNGSNASPGVPNIGILGSDGGCTATYLSYSAYDASSEPFWNFVYAVGSSTLGSDANKATASIGEFENDPVMIIASFLAA